MPSHDQGPADAGLPRRLDLAVPVGANKALARRLDQGVHRQRVDDGASANRQHPEHDEPARQQRRASARHSGAGSFRPRRTGSTSRTGNILRNMLAQILTGKLTIKQAAQSASDNITLGPQRIRERSGTRITIEPASRPQVAAVAAEPPTLGARRRRPSHGVAPSLAASCRTSSSLPVVVAIGAILGYPLYQLVTLSFQQYGLPELIQRKGEWIGLDNYRSVLGDQVFWDTLLRTVVFTAVNVGARRWCSALLIALLLVRALDAGARPADHRARARLGDARRRRRPGLVLDDELPERRPQLRPHRVSIVGDFFQHDWYATTFSKLAMVTLLDRLGRAPVRHAHALRGARAGAARARSRPPQIDGAERVARVPRRHASRSSSRSC